MLENFWLTKVKGEWKERRRLMYYDAFRSILVLQCVVSYMQYQK